MCSDRSGMFSCFHRYFDLSDLIQFGWGRASAHKHIGCMHNSLCARVDLCTQKDPACYPDSIDTLISLVQSNLAELCAFARKHIGGMHTSLHAWVDLCALKDLACHPDSIDTLISLIRSNLTEIWAYARKHIGCMHNSLCAWVDSYAQKIWHVILIP